jgi:hypothetical protein
VLPGPACRCPVVTLPRSSLFLPLPAADTGPLTHPTLLVSRTHATLPSLFGNPPLPRARAAAFDSQPGAAHHRASPPSLLLLPSPRGRACRAPPFSLAAPRSRAPSKGVGHRPRSPFLSILLHPLRVAPPLISPLSMSTPSSGRLTASSLGVQATTDVGFCLLGEPLLRASWLPIAVHLTFPLPPRYCRATPPSPPVARAVSPPLNATA